MWTPPFLQSGLLSSELLVLDDAPSAVGFTWEGAAGFPSSTLGKGRAAERSSTLFLRDEAAVCLVFAGTDLVETGQGPCGAAGQTGITPFESTPGTIPRQGSLPLKAHLWRFLDRDHSLWKHTCDDT